jgi:ribosome biogenesis ATPase
MVGTDMAAIIRLQSANLLQSESSARVVNTLLTELDGLDSRKSVYVIAATNRPDMIDPAMVRPGRLDKLLYVDLPRPDERAEIVRTMTRRVPLGGLKGESEAMVKASVEAMVRDSCEGYSGADLAAIVREAGVIALRRTLGILEKMEGGDATSNLPTVTVGSEDFVNALGKVGPSVSAGQRQKYESLKWKFAGLPVGGKKDDGLLYNS